jgi:Domain of unknown function (DUF5615)
VRFLLDHDVDAAVGQTLRQRGHECWTAGSAGLARARDDELTVWAASEVLADHLDGVLSLLEARNDLTVRVSKEGLSDSSKWT